MPKTIPANRKQDGGIGSIMQSWCFPNAICGHHAVRLALFFLDITPSPASFWDPSPGIGVPYSLMCMVASVYESFRIDRSESV